MTTLYPTFNWKSFALKFAQAVDEKDEDWLHDLALEAKRFDAIPCPSINIGGPLGGKTDDEALLDEVARHFGTNGALWAGESLAQKVKQSRPLDIAFVKQEADPAPCPTCGDEGCVEPNHGSNPPRKKQDGA